MKMPGKMMVDGPPFCHVYNRAGGPVDALPFDDVAKERVFKRRVLVDRPKLVTSQPKFVRTLSGRSPPPSHD